MYALLKITQILPCLLIGLIIGSAISGDTALLGWSIFLLVADIVVGISLQFIINNRNSKATSKKWSPEDSEALYKLLLATVNQDNGGYTDSDADLSDSDFTEEEYEQKPDDICSKFERAYSDLEKCRGSVYTTFNKALSETYGAILLDVCNHIPHAPLSHTLVNFYEISTNKINGCNAIVYTFLFHQNSMCENVNIVLVHHNETIRLFAVETDIQRYVLCEYYGYRHINYGFVSLGEIETKIGKILN